MPYLAGCALASQYGHMWTLMIGMAVAVEVGVGGPYSTRDTLADVQANHGTDLDLVIRLDADLVVDDTVVFTGHDSLRIISASSGPYRLIGAASLGNGEPMVIAQGVGTFALEGIGVSRPGNSPGPAASSDGSLELVDVTLDDYRHSGSGAVFDAAGALTVRQLSACGGDYDGPLLRADGLMTVDDSVLEGMLGAGPLVESRAGGTLEHLTIASTGLQRGLAAYTADLTVRDSVIDTSNVAVEAFAGATVQVDHSGFRGGVGGLSDPGIDLSVDPFLHADDAAHCGFDARPLAGGALWDVGGDHVGGYHGVVPFDGWDDDDLDGAGYGADCDDDDPARYPGADEICSAVDVDCDGFAYAGNVPAGQGEEAWVDGDFDGLGAFGTEPLMWCIGQVEPGWADNDDDCDDLVPGQQGELFYRDGDGDGFAIEATTQEACAASPGWIEFPDDGVWDCDDLQSDAYPGAPEVCSKPQVDNDCDTLLPDVDPDCATSSTTPGDDDDDDTSGTNGTTGTNGQTTVVSPKGEAAAGCACSSTAGPTGLLALLALPAWLRRRRGA